MLKRKPKSEKMSSPVKRTSRLKKEGNNQSVIKFLWWNLTFTNEPLWFKLTVFILCLITTLAIVWALKIWIAPTLVIQKLSNVKLSSIIHFFKK